MRRVFSCIDVALYDHRRFAGSAYRGMIAPARSCQRTRVDHRDTLAMRCESRGLDHDNATEPVRIKFEIASQHRKVRHRHARFGETANLHIFAYQGTRINLAAQGLETSKLCRRTDKRRALPC